MDSDKEIKKYTFGNLGSIEIFSFDGIEDMSADVLTFFTPKESDNMELSAFAQSGCSACSASQPSPTIWEYCC